jgi:hypothetical protein
MTDDRPNGHPEPAYRTSDLGENRLIRSPDSRERQRKPGPQTRCNGGSSEGCRRFINRGSDSTAALRGCTAVILKSGGAV